MIVSDVRPRLLDVERSRVFSTARAETEPSQRYGLKLKNKLNTAVDEINAWFPSKIKNRPMKQAAGYGVNIKTGSLMTGK
jgi:hypothetical protein